MNGIKAEPGSPTTTTDDFMNMESGTIFESPNKVYRQRRGWTEEAMAEALKQVRNGVMSMTKACVEYNIPQSTLQLRMKQQKVKSKFMKKKFRGNGKCVDNELEKSLAEWHLQLARTGFTLKHSELRETVQKCLKENEEFAASARRFKDGMPSEGWVSLFQNRQSKLLEKAEKQKQKFNPNVNGPDAWYSAVRSYLSEENKSDLLEKPFSVFCGEELSFELNVTTGEVSYPFQPNSLVHRKSDREIVTIFCVACADGTLAPPMVVYPCENLPDVIAESMPEGWAVGCSGDGWIKSQTIFEYITCVFYPWLCETPEKFPVILFMSNRRGHMSYQLSKFCAEKNIILFGCPEEMAVTRSVFRQVMDSWAEVRNAAVINKINFAPSVQPIFAQKNTEALVKQSFAECDLYPLKSSAPAIVLPSVEPPSPARKTRPPPALNAVPSPSNGYAKKPRPPSPSSHSGSSTPVATSSKDARRSGRSTIMSGLRLQETLIRSSSTLFANYVETWIDPEIKSQFLLCKRSGVWSGEPSYAKLFDLWYQLSSVDE